MGKWVMSNNRGIKLEKITRGKGVSRNNRDIRLE